MRGPIVLALAMGCAILASHRDQLTLAAQPSAAAPAYESDADVGLVDLGPSPCPELWSAFDNQHDIIRREQPKPGVTPLFKSAIRTGLTIIEAIQAANCPVKDKAAFDNMIGTIRALNAVAGER